MWFGSEGSSTSCSSCAVLGVSSGSCKLAALPLIAVGHADVACPGFPHIMQRLFSWWCLCSSGFSLPSGPRMHSLTQVVVGLVLLGPHRFTFISSLLSLWCTSFHSSCLSQYRLSYHWVTSTSSCSELGLPSIDSQSLSHSGRPS